MKYNVKDAIKEFISYKPNNNPFIVKLDANESSKNMSLLQANIDVTSLNLYPDNRSEKLRSAIANKMNVSSDEVMVGAGSSELLELVVKTFINPNDVVLSVEPSFVMYKKYTMISGGIYQTVQAKNNYETVVSDMIEGIKKYNPKIVFLCTPNNPTGFMLSKEEVLTIIKATTGIVVVDEAYMEYASSDESVIEYINKYPNIIVNRTFSKAYGLAGARLGYFISNKELIETLFTAKTPYSVTSLSQELGYYAINEEQYLIDNVTNNKVEKNKVMNQLNDLKLSCFPSEGNFIYATFSNFDLAEKLAEKKVLIRSFKNGFYRITIGKAEENEILIKALKEVLYENSNN